MLDLLLACLHHLLIFALFAMLLTEFLLLRPGFDGATLKRVAGIDLAYGVLAGVLLIVGLCRAAFAAKGWIYTAQIKSDRPAGDFTARLIPRHSAASIPLEAPQILWQR